MARTSSAPPPPPADPDDTGNAASDGAPDSTASDSTGAPTGDGPASAAPAPGDNPNRFFAWLRSLGVERQPGWVGGVSAGIASRLGIDPLIVRGGFVVVALLGGPALVIYAVAWLVLPDAQNKIHLEQVLRGRFESAIAGIAALIALSMLPLTQGFWYAGSAFWGDPILPDAIGRALWTFVIIGLLAWGIVWMVRRSSATRPERPAAPEMPGPPAASATQATTIPYPAAAAPTAPAPDAPEEEFAAWRQQQQAWKNEYDAYRHHNAEASLRAQELHRQRRLATSAANAERMRAWHRANPRLRASIVFMVLGAAIVAGGIASQVAPDGKAWVVGLGVATLVVGVSIIAAGLFRRRNGFLSFVAMVLLPATLVAAFVPTDRQLLWNVGSVDILSSGRYAQAGQTLFIEDLDHREGADSEPALPENPVNVDVWHAGAETWIVIPVGTTVHLVADVRSGSVYRQTYVNRVINPALAEDYNEDGVADEYDDMNGDGVIDKLDNRTVEQTNTEVPATSRNAGGTDSWDVTYGKSAAGTPPITITLWQGTGNVFVQDTYPEGN